MTSCCARQGRRAVPKFVTEKGMKAEESYHFPPALVKGGRAGAGEEGGLLNGEWGGAGAKDAARRGFAGRL